MERKTQPKRLEKYIEKHQLRTFISERALTQAQIHVFEPEEFIMRAGFELTYYYLLVSGKIKVSYILENGRSVLLKFYKEFNALGDVELLKQTPINCNIQAVTQATLIAIPVAVLRETCMEDPRFLHHVIHDLSDKFLAVANNSSYNLVYPLVNRFASYLVEHLDTGDQVVLSAAYQEIAQFLGTTYRHLHRTIKGLEAEGTIRCEGKVVYVLDRARLSALSKNLYVHSIEY